MIDHDRLRFVMVNGAVEITEDKTLALNDWRDPCQGFLNIRQEVVEVLVKAMHLRWGACMFGCGPDGDADMMHFDLGLAP